MHTSLTALSIKSPIYQLSDSNYQKSLEIDEIINFFKNKYPGKYKTHLIQMGLPEFCIENSSYNKRQYHLLLEIYCKEKAYYNMDKYKLLKGELYV